MKKKIITALLTGVMVLAVGCGSKAGSGNITLGEYKGITVTSISQEAFDAEINNILESYAEFVEVERPAQNGDIVNINYVGTLDGEEFEGGADTSDAGTDLELGAGMFIEGFEEGLIGAKAGEEKVLNLKFPEDYYEDLAGKDVVFTVTVNRVQEKVVPELTDEFVTENLAPYTTVDGFTTEFRENLNKESYDTQITQTLLDSCEVIEYVEEEVTTAKESLLSYWLSYAEYYATLYGYDVDTMLYLSFGIPSAEEAETAAEESAYLMVKNTMIMEEIANVEGIKVSEEEYNTRALEYAAEYGYEDIATFETDYGKEEIERTILMDIVKEFLLEQVVIVDAE